MKMHFTRREGMALYMFGAKNLDTTIGNLYGAATLAGREDVKELLFNMTTRLSIPWVAPAIYAKQYCRVRMDIAQDLKDAMLHFQQCYGDTANTCPWRYFAKAVIFDVFCTNDLHASRRLVRTLSCYVRDSQIKEIIQDVLDTLDDIINNDCWNYENYLLQYQAFACGVNECIHDGEEAILDYIWGVKDVKLE